MTMSDVCDSSEPGTPAEPKHEPIERWSRRGVLAALGSLGIGSAVFQRALAAQAEKAGKITPEMLDQALWIAGIELAEEDRAAVAGAVERDQQKFAALRQVPLGYDVPPAMLFFVAPPQEGSAAIDRTAV